MFDTKLKDERTRAKVVRSVLFCIGRNAIAQTVEVVGHILCLGGIYPRGLQQVRTRTVLEQCWVVIQGTTSGYVQGNLAEVGSTVRYRSFSFHSQ